MVYKGIDKVTGETVAIKHVSLAFVQLTKVAAFSRSNRAPSTNLFICARLILNPATMIFKTFKPKSLSSALALAPT